MNKLKYFSLINFRTLKGRGLPGSSVSFRQGTNVEIGPPSFMGSEGAGGVIIIIFLIKYTSAGICQ